MTTDNLLTIARDVRWQAIGVVALLALIALALTLRRLRRYEAATVVTTLSTLLGLAWSAQGMWDTAVHHYRQDVLVASVLFVVFESMMLARMLKARQFRADLRRRAKHVRAVWLIACVMALVVALGEGWAQAPARLAIPLLVAYGWWTDLTADDDPDEKLKTSLRWTPRRFALAIGMLEPEARDARTLDRDRLRDRLTRLAFRHHHGATWLNDLLRRSSRLSRLKTLADDGDLHEVRTRLARMSVDLMAPPAPTRLIIPERRIDLSAKLSERVQGVHARDGQLLRGADLRRDAVLLMRASVLSNPPRGMTIAELAAHYDPPLKQRTAETFAAEARKVNGHSLP
jgi:hypothetical protein